ncbi:MAG: hypothetical protein AAF411_26250, partial [Myxococcota bacterium]
MNAVVALPVSIESLRAHLRVEHEEGSEVHFRVTGRTLVARALEDGVCVGLDLAYSTPPETLGTILRRDFGETIAERAFVFPHVAKPSATTYEALVEEVGAGGEWVSVPSAEAATPGVNLEGLASSLGPAAAAKMQSMMENPEAMNQLA